MGYPSRSCTREGKGNHEQVCHFLDCLGCHCHAGVRHSRGLGTMMGFYFSVRAETKALVRDLGYLADKQIPFAAATALNAVGAIVRDQERQNIKTVFPTATPFTVNSVVLLKARKDSLFATVLVKDAAAKYLLPFEQGGRHFLNSRALLNPKNINLNQYGNIPKNKLAALRGRSDVFIGSVKGKNGDISGVWQRIPAIKGVPARKGRAAIAGTPGKLKLLIRFGDALTVKQRLGYVALAGKLISANYPPEFTKAMNAAIATARP